MSSVNGCLRKAGLCIYTIENNIKVDMQSAVEHENPFEIPGSAQKAELIQ